MRVEESMYRTVGMIADDIATLQPTSKNLQLLRRRSFPIDVWTFHADLARLPR